MWLRYTIAAVLNTRQSTRCFVNYSTLISDWRATTNKIAADLGIVWPRTGPSVEREIDTFLHKNELADVQRTSVAPDANHIDDLSLMAQADALYAVLAASGDDTNLIDKIAQAYRKRMLSSADIVGAYEDLFPTIWQYYENHLTSEKRNQIASERIAGMSGAVQNLWQDLAKASSEASVVQQNLGSHAARVESLEAALDHHGKMLAESNEYKDRYFAELGLVHQDLAQAQVVIAVLKQDKAEAMAALRTDRDQRIAEVISEKDRISTEIISQKDKITTELIEIVDAMRRSTSWRLTGPMRRVVRWIKGR